jgi:hypothetical protein
MSYLNANIPPIYCKIRKEYLYDLDPKYNKESEECVIFGIASIAGRAFIISHPTPERCGLLSIAYQRVFPKTFF